MFKLLNRFKNKKEQVISLLVEPNITTSKITVKDIHNAFHNELINIILENQNLLNEDCDIFKIEKANTLKSLGFYSTKTFEENQEEQTRLDSIIIDNRKKIKLQKAISYFTTKYPFYKFITEESVNKLCEKYGLVYGLSCNYIGTIPDKNIKEIKNFKIDNKDKIYHVNYKHNWSHSGRLKWEEVQHHKLEQMKGEIDHDYIEMFKKSGEKIPEWALNKRKSSDYYISEVVEFEIVAPLKDFKKDKVKVIGNKLTQIVEDPIVLVPVTHENTKYFLIVSCWGNESSDELVVNNINN